MRYITLYARLADRAIAYRLTTEREGDPDINPRTVLNELAGMYAAASATNVAWIEETDLAGIMPEVCLEKYLTDHCAAWDPDLPATEIEMIHGDLYCRDLLEKATAAGFIPEAAT